jgi:hypothetical protein
MSRIQPKQPRQRLDPESYDRLRQQVLQRDGWRCQCCGTRSKLEVHHQEFRSHEGNDLEANLITLFRMSLTGPSRCEASDGLSVWVRPTARRTVTNLHSCRGISERLYGQADNLGPPIPVKFWHLMSEVGGLTRD